MGGKKFDLGGPLVSELDFLSKIVFLDHLLRKMWALSWELLWFIRVYP